jgi:oxygen-independent coproporphyrinogen-3 oxidase
MDHFAKPTDELAIAQKSGKLTRDFQGYSTGGPSDLISFGVSAISKIGPVYAQNVKALDAYREMLGRDELPVQRGIELGYDDLLRRAVIQSLSCQFELSKESIGIAYLVDFDRYFATELEQLKTFVDDGLVELDDDWITVTHRGRLLVRAICMVFDRHLRAAHAPARYSRVM